MCVESMAKTKKYCNYAPYGLNSNEIWFSFLLDVPDLTFKKMAHWGEKAEKLKAQLHLLNCQANNVDGL